MVSSWQKNMCSRATSLAEDIAEKEPFELIKPFEPSEPFTKTTPPDYHLSPSSPPTPFQLILKSLQA